MLKMYVYDFNSFSMIIRVYIYIYIPKDTTYYDRKMFLCTRSFVDLPVIYLRKMQKQYVLLQMNDIALHKSETTHVGSMCIHYMFWGNLYVHT